MTKLNEQEQAAETWACEFTDYEASEGVPDYSAWEIFDAETQMSIIGGTIDPSDKHVITTIVENHNNPPIPPWVKPYLERVAGLANAWDEAAALPWDGLGSFDREDAQNDVLRGCAFALRALLPIAVQVKP